MNADFDDPEYRSAYVDAMVSNSIAFQIRAMRQKRGLSQQQLANLLQTTQNAVSRIENPDYGRASVATLKSVARAFDVALLVKFVSFGELAHVFLHISRGNRVLHDLRKRFETLGH